MLPIHKASVQGLGLGRPVYRRSSNGNYRSTITSPRNDGSFGQNIQNKWLRALVLTVRRPKFWYVLTALLGFTWLVMSMIYLPTFLWKTTYTNSSGGMCTYFMSITTTTIEIASLNICFVGFSGPHIRSGKNDHPDVINPTDSDLESIGREIDTALDNFLKDLNEKFTVMDKPDVQNIWRTYTESAELHLLPLDRKTKQNKGLFPVQKDKSIFISIISYGYGNCPMILKDIYSKALHPDKVAIGLVEENFESDNNHKKAGGDKNESENHEDEDEGVSNFSCYERFCATDFGKPYCDKKAIRMLQLDEKNWLGHSVARYLGAKLWRGENFFFQVDSNFLWSPKWDESLIKDINETPTYPKSVLSYNPRVVEEEGLNSQLEETVTPQRICGAKFPAEQFPIAGIDSDIIQLDINNGENRITQKNSEDGKPCPTAFLKSDFIFANGDMLSTVPFDPFVPWLSIGEETVLSLRMWTWGFNFYGPTKSVVGYNHNRDHPSRAAQHRKIWETSGHLLNNVKYYLDVSSRIAHRVKHIIGYPESSKAMISVSGLPSVLMHQVWFCEIL